jgi:cell wall-associated NlpC family hydrolase
MLPAWAAQYIGIPFLARGRDRNGCDCWGLARMVWAEQYGLLVPEYLGYENTNDGSEIAPYIAAHVGEWEEIDLEKERPGDGVLMRIKNAAMHVGVVVDRGWMLHSFTGVNSCCERYGSPQWKKRVVGFYRNKALA